MDNINRMRNLHTKTSAEDMALKCTSKGPIPSGSSPSPPKR